jgi:hypothetical protein
MAARISVKTAMMMLRGRTQRSSLTRWGIAGVIFSPDTPARFGAARVRRERPAINRPAGIGHRIGFPPSSVKKALLGRMDDELAALLSVSEL